jgi:hypothetical protein
MSPGLSDEAIREQATLALLMAEHVGRSRKEVTHE